MARLSMACIRSSLSATTCRCIPSSSKMSLGCRNSIRRTGSIRTREASTSWWRKSSPRCAPSAKVTRANPMADAPGRAGAPVRFQAGHSTGREWDRIAQGCLDSMGPVDPAANLGFLYVSDPLAGHMLSLLAYMRDKTGIQHWVGTVGVGVLGGGREYFDEAAMVVMTASLPRGSFQIVPGITDEGASLAPSVTRWLREHR